jgi:hypothetical protein
MPAALSAACDAWLPGSEWWLGRLIGAVVANGSIGFGTSIYGECKLSEVVEQQAD